jgi:hypothetical protein
VIDFSFLYGNPSDYSGILFPLVMATIAALTAVFRSITLVQNITSTTLQVLIRQVSVGLLDSRLTLGASDSNGALDVESSTQLVKALNRLAIQAAIGSPRNTSLHSLLMLQIEYASRVNDFQPERNSRLARICTKLYTRVIKSEEASTSAFARHIDIGALLCTVEKFLFLSSEIEHRFSLKDNNLSELATLLLTAIINAKGTSSEHELKIHMNRSGLDWNKSLLGGLIKKKIAELGGNASSTENNITHDMKKTERFSPQRDENTSGMR